MADKLDVFGAALNMEGVHEIIHALFPYRLYEDLDIRGYLKGDVSDNFDHVLLQSSDRKVPLHSHGSDEYFVKVVAEGVDSFNIRLKADDVRIIISEGFMFWPDSVFEIRLESHIKV